MADRAAAAAAASAPPGGGGATGDLPADALAVRGILRSMGAEEADPRVLAMLLDFVYTYSADVLQDAERYADALGRPPGVVEAAEVTFAMQARAGAAFCQPPGQDVLQKLADEVNAIDLPEFPLRHGLRLPPTDQCLVMPNWELLPPGAGGGGGTPGGAGGGGAARRQQGGGSGGGAAPMDTS